MKIKNLILILNLLSAGYLKSGNSSPDNFWDGSAAQPAETLWQNPAQSLASDRHVDTSVSSDKGPYTIKDKCKDKCKDKWVYDRATQTENMTVADFSDTTHTNYFVVNKSLARTNNYNRAILRCLTVAAVFYFAWRSK